MELGTGTFWSRRDTLVLLILVLEPISRILGGSSSYTASGTGLDSGTGVTGTGAVPLTDYESRTGYGSGSYTGSPYTG